MPIICDTHIPLFWAHEPERLTAPARQALELGRTKGELAIADITLWELALLHERGRLLSRSDRFLHGDLADRLIGATALHLGAPLITADAKLRAVSELDALW